RFWYRNAFAGGTKAFVLVEAVRGTREPAFDHARLAEALSKAADQPFAPDRLPFDRIVFADGTAAVRFRAAGKTWRFDRASGELKEDGGALPVEASVQLPRLPNLRPRNLSPDG